MQLDMKTERTLQAPGSHTPFFYSLVTITLGLYTMVSTTISMVIFRLIYFMLDMVV